MGGTERPRPAKIIPCRGCFCHLVPPPNSVPRVPDNQVGLRPGVKDLPGKHRFPAVKQIAPPQNSLPKPANSSSYTFLLRLSSLFHLPATRRKSRWFTVTEEKPGIKFIPGFCTALSWMAGTSNPYPASVSGYCRYWLPLASSSSLHTLAVAPQNNSSLLFTINCDNLLVMNWDG